MIYMAVCMFSLIHNNTVLNNKMYDKSQTNCFLQPVKTITPGGALGTLFWSPGRAAVCKMCSGSVGLFRTGSQGCATDQGSACGYAVCSVQPAVGRGWSADGAGGVHVPPHREKAGCVLRSRLFGCVFSPDPWPWLHCMI